MFEKDGVFVAIYIKDIVFVFGPCLTRGASGFRRIDDL